MSRFLTRAERAWLIASVVLGLGGIAGAVWTEYAVSGAAIAFVAGALIPIKDLLVRSHRRRVYLAPIGTMPDSPRMAESYRAVLDCLQNDVSKGLFRFDTLKAVNLAEIFKDRIAFATEPRTVEVITKINLWSFDGSIYGRRDEAFAFQKQIRNVGITNRNPFTFALLQDSRNPDIETGFTSVLPLTADGARRYFSAPGVEDNLLSPDMVAVPGDFTADFLLFAMGHLKIYRGNKVFVTPGLEPASARYQEKDAKTATELIRTACYQLGVLIAAMDDAAELRLVCQSSVPGVQRMLQSIGFSPAPHIETGDAEPAFVLLIRPINRAAAREFLKASGVAIV